MHSVLILNYLAMLASVVAAFFFGGLWYGPLFGRTWGTIMGMDMSKKTCAKDMIKPMALQIIGCVLTVYVMADFLRGPIDPNPMGGLFLSLTIWIGFYVPLQLNKVGWEMRPWKLFIINAGHDLINLLIIGQILANWR